MSNIRPITDTIVGASSIGVIEILPDAVQNVDITNPNIVSTILQIIVTIVTLIKLLKKNKPVNP